MAKPDLVVIGHVVQDLMPRGWRLGGTTTFAAVQGERLGLRVGIVTRVGPDLSLEKCLPGIAVAGRRATCTTRFENVYDGARRRQRVPDQAEGLSVEDIPSTWREAPIALLGPVCGEVPPGLATVFSSSLVGASAQGWLRRLDRERQVRRRVWTGAPFWSGCRALFVSVEDLGGRREQVARWAEEVSVVGVTEHRRGARVCVEGRWQRMEAFPATEVDATGAGDVFAAAFLVRYHETEDVPESARFASAAAACSVEAPGTEGIAARREIEVRMKEHPEIVLR